MILKDNYNYYVFGEINGMFDCKEFNLGVLSFGLILVLVLLLKYLLIWIIFVFFLGFNFVIYRMIVKDYFLLVEFE